jgi:phosphoribosylamine-glycine ligase
MQLLESRGVSTPPTHLFNSFDKAKQFIKDHKGSLVFKPCGELPPDTTYVSMSPDNEDMLYHLDKLEKLSKGSEFILQEKVSGIEVSTECLYYRGKPILPCNSTFEEKKMLNGNLGPSVGCAGSVVVIWEGPCFIYDQIFKPLERMLASNDYTGPLDWNCIFDPLSNKLYVLEATCYDDQTEILTKDGFKFFKDLSLKDEIATLNPNNHCLEYQKPNKLINVPYSGLMYEFKGKGKNPHFDLCVTPNHQMYIKHCWRKDWCFKRADEINLNGTKIKRTCYWKGEEVETIILPGWIEKHYLGKYKKTMDIQHPEIKIKMDDWLKFFGLYLAEGSTNQYQTFISQMVKIDKVKDLLKDFPIPYKIYGHHLCFQSGQLTRYIKSLGLGKCNEKFVPNEFKSLSKRQLKILLNSFILGDGCIHKRTGQRTYYTTSKRLADDLQELFLKIGSVANIVKNKVKGSTLTINGKTYQRKYNGYSITERTVRKDSVIFKRHIHKINYSGNVYCCEVPNHILCVRRNGTVSFSGNSRFGYDAIQNLCELMTLPVSQVFYSWGMGELETIPLNSNLLSLAVRVTIPFEIGAKDAPEEEYIGGYEGADGFWFSDVKMNSEGKLVTAGWDGNIVTVVSTAPTVRECQAKVYAKLDKLILGSKQYRTDIGDRFDRDWGIIKRANDLANPQVEEHSLS